jgi:hypothetical protein
LFLLEKTIAAAGTPFSARRTIVFFQKLMNYARRAGYYSGSNPVEDVILPAGRRRSFRRADGSVVAFGKMGDLEPGRDAADPANIHLHDGAGPALQIINHQIVEDSHFTITQKT